MNIRLKPMSQQVVVVMGASSGIGRITALKFARHGARVVVAARNDNGLQSLVEQIRAEGGEAEALAADVAHFDQVQAVAEHAVRVYGRLDTWVHLAAVSLYANFEDTTPEEFRQVIDVNLLGQVHGAMAALPHLRRTGRGALIHISSVEARRAFPWQSAYSSSKHGILGFVDALRLELMHQSVPISVTNIMPASIDTPFFHKAKTKIGVLPQGAPPIYQPEQVADAILYAAENPVRDLVVGAAGKMMVVGQALSPQMMDALMLKMGFTGQRTEIPKLENAPNNLFAPVDGFNQIKGGFGKGLVSPMPGRQHRQPSMVQRLSERVQENSGVTTAVAGLALGAIALVASKMLGSNGTDRAYAPALRRVPIPTGPQTREISIN
jgi:NAD(P)-dependent dehydrogenase (short-subunit alcohol dehydrogenase family)